MTLGKMPLKGLLYHHRKIAFEQASNVCEKQCLQVGFTYMILDVAFKRIVNVCMKQCLWVGLTCMILDVALQRATAVCMYYHIFIIDGHFEPTCVTLICITPQFHRFINGF